MRNPASPPAVREAFSQKFSGYERETMEEKTNVMRTLERLKLPYRHYAFDTGGAAPSGTEVAALLGKDPAQVFKTLVTVGKSGKYYVFMIPVAEELDLRKAARCAGEKSIEMIKTKDLLPLTGYVHGGCSPVGMKKPFPTWIDETALLTDAFFCSAGRLGAQIGIDPETLAGYVGAQFADLTEE